MMPCFCEMAAYKQIILATFKSLETVSFSFKICLSEWKGFFLPRKNQKLIAK